MSAESGPEPPKPGTDPSMEDILSSIRRILNEEPAAPAPAADSGVLILDETMMVSDPAPPSLGTPSPAPQSAAPALVAPETAAAAAVSVDALVRQLVAERSTHTHRGGPTIEDLVREEIRPLLKQWLDTHLPPLVERLVHAEIERLTNRLTP